LLNILDLTGLCHFLSAHASFMELNSLLFADMPTCCQRPTTLYVLWNKHMSLEGPPVLQ